MTGIVNVAPWHASTEAFDIAAAPVRVAWVSPFVEPTLAGTLIDKPVWLVKLTPLGEQPEWPLSGVMLPFPDTPVTVTG